MQNSISVFIVLLKYSPAHLFMYCLWLLLLSLNRKCAHFCHNGIKENKKSKG